MPITVFLNRRSGSVSQKTESELRTLLANRANIEELQPETLSDRVKALPAGTTVVAGGGDGSVAGVAEALIGTDKKLGILPLGTLNHLARDLKIPNDLASAVRVLLEGTSIEIDTACVNGKSFLNNSALGLYPKLVLYREHLEKKGSPRWAALCRASIYILTRYRTMEVKFEIEGKTVIRRSPLVFVGNNVYTLQGLGAGSRESLREGVLSVVIARHQGAWSFLVGMLKAVAGLQKDGEPLETLELHSLTVRTRSNRVVVSTDGEVSVMRSPLEYSIRPRSLSVVVPTA